MRERLSFDTWRQRLASKGHRIAEQDETERTSFGIWPDPGTIITVAVDPDGTLKPDYRQRYFLCECEPEQIFRLVGCPEPHRNRWLELLSRQPEGYWHDFLAGPGAWTLARLTQFREVVTWAERGLAWTALEDRTYRDWGMDVPTEAIRFSQATHGTEAYQPYRFSSGDERFADAVAACFLFASVDLRDCYLADAEGSEVYLAHHHDKVVISIPDAVARETVLQELSEAAWLVEDVSGYAYSGDEDEGQDE